MPNCDVCLVECRDGGVLACGHVVCRSCGMSQSKCLVCAEVVGRHRKRRTNPLPPDGDMERSPSPPPSPSPGIASPAPLALPARRSRSPRPLAASPLLTTSSSPLEDDATPEPVGKAAGKEGIMSVHGPTAYDEVRCELRAEGRAPSLARSALRTSGKLSVALLARFVHTVLGLEEGDAVVLGCSGEELSGRMTLGHLVAHVWPSAEGHMVLDYRIVPAGKD